MLAIDRFIHVPHIVCCDFAGEGVECKLYLRPALEGFGAHKRYGLIGREVMPVIFKRDKAECADGPSVEFAAMISTWCA